MGNILFFLFHYLDELRLKIRNLENVLIKLRRILLTLCIRSSNSSQTVMIVVSILKLMIRIFNFLFVCLLIYSVVDG